MKSSLKKLRGFALPKHEHKEKRDYHFPSQLDELAQASQDMQDMRNCYDSLLAAAAATTNCAFEFSESLREMGACLLEKTALNDDEESGRVLLMLGKVQFGLQKLLDSYRSHIVQTISTPSESLLNELRTVEDMKRQCDEKRAIYEEMLTTQKEKGRSKGARGEYFSSQQLQAAQEEYDEEATLFVFRLKSLKQGQSRSLLTQAARHHAAQLNFFRKGLKFLEAVEPHVELVAERQHIDYQFSGLEDDDPEDGDDDYGDDTNDDGELSFDYGQNDHGQDVVSTSRNSMELDQADHSFIAVSTMESAKENLDKNQGDLPALRGEHRTLSQSAPIFPDKKFDPVEKIREMQPSSTRKFHTYVLPTPVDTKGSLQAGSGSHDPGARQTIMSTRTHNLWHSSPLEPKKHIKDPGDDPSSDHNHNLKAQSVLKESNSSSIRTPPPLAEGLTFPRFDLRMASDTKKIKRYAFSGPLTSKGWSSKPLSSASGPISSVDHPQRVSAMLSRMSRHHQSTSPRVSPPASPPMMSSPKISELHELPRPPVSLAKPTRQLGSLGHSAPLVSRSRDHSPTKVPAVMASQAASPLPTPPGAVTRSYSIPSNSQRAAVLSADTAEEVASPPLTPISLTSAPSASTAYESVSQPGKVRGMD